jgi:hypothetical protein
MVLRGRPRGRVGHRRTFLPEKADPHRDRPSLRYAPNPTSHPHPPPPRTHSIPTPNAPHPKSRSTAQSQGQLPKVKGRPPTSVRTARANFRRHSFGRPAESFPDRPALPSPRQPDHGGKGREPATLGIAPTPSQPVTTEPRIIPGARRLRSAGPPAARAPQPGRQYLSPQAV